MTAVAAEPTTAQTTRIDLVLFIADVLTGAIGDEPMPFVSAQFAEIAVEKALVARIGRPLNKSERVRVGIQVVSAWNAFYLNRSIAS